MSQEREKVLIVGIGNELMGDEGLGVHVARSLLAAQASLPAHVEVIEAGTSLLDVLPRMPGYSRVIIVDAVRAGNEPGSVYRLEPAAGLAAQLEPGAPLSLHDWDLTETLRAAALLGLMPAKLSLVGAEPERICLSTGLSPRLAEAAKKIESLLLAEALA